MWMGGVGVFTGRYCQDGRSLGPGGRLWYIWAMRTLRQRGFLGPAALLLAAVFFVAQAFACCQANARIGRGLVSLFAPAPVHACCAKAHPAAAPVKSDCARGCCISDGVRNAPQLASAPSDLPVLSGPLAFLAPLIAPSVANSERPAPVIDSGPPLYLRTLRLLV